ncbi:hypothetical protein [Stenotrophomonas phage A1432]|uniref:Uncharacterized protein n=1 Tax=Stenotrophomonas phage A1432 TaxID=2930315 RepID=A0A9E7SSJ7_9CAUD|nr:hypothetical protein P9A45_gp47 [Stenotrophomonas phage A1432]UTC27983.1 hypothetical protein [Stenotrophomonas phage A1432]
MTERNPDWRSSWRTRRRFMFAIAAFCMWVIGYVLYKDLSSSPADTAITMAFLTLISIVGSYVFGATWEDVSIAKAKISKAPHVGKPAPGPGASAAVEDAP